MQAFRSSSLALLCAATLLGISSSSYASVIAVTNGSFESTSYAGSNKLNATSLSGAGLQQVTGWTSNNYNSGTVGYNFVFTPGTADTTGAYLGVPGYYLTLWGQNNGGLNAIPSSPAGGNFIGMDGAYEQGTLSQVLTGLVVGMDTQVSFYYAGAQQSGFTGATTEGFKVSLAGVTTESHNTAILSDVSHGFTGWHYAELDFTPTSTTETLSFLALGTPNGLPPFSLLDGISVVQVTPEPSSLALMGTGVLSLCGLLRRRYVRR